MMAANRRQTTGLIRELQGQLPRSRPPNWPGGVHWERLWDVAEAHVHGHVPRAELSRHYLVPESQIRAWLWQAQQLWRRLEAQR